ncbi:cyclic-di-AMP-binding protein CbpB [Ligilactobacillus equi]|uniref:CBS domain protein n=2 Tax=Ligilactobacillus equi TaxID=137357 RepID=V7HVU0_9LACO|nr:cyclic-di-AMP-binding protein CbpB [Ligilactobacillus equi]ETA74022.1 CBS domain protein [Ligilactobacillus equi DPC 6820]KRL81489.1 CBS domain protein [Ligilactobacillus equi DSM 15833 = JCM 10991]
MIAQAIEDLLASKQTDFIISADKVANVLDENYLDHALLVLTKVRYAKIPVLDKDQHFKGLLSLAMITEKMLGLEGIDPSVLNQHQVKEVMQTEVPIVTVPFDLENVLHLLVDQAFLVVVDQNEIFKGIITRREIMKGVNYVAHKLEQEYELFPKNYGKAEND